MNSVKVSVMGFLAGGLSFLTLILIIYLGLAVFGLFFSLPQAFIEARAADALPTDNSPLELVWGSLTGNLQNLLKGLWEARWGFLLGGFLGLVAAWSYQIVLGIREERTWLASFIGLMIVASISVITWANILREEATLQVVESPELYAWRDLLVGSFTTTVIVALIFTLTVTAPFWAVWRWWYQFIAGRLAPTLLKPKPGAAPGSQPTAMAEHLSYAARLHALKRADVTVAGSATALPDVRQQATPASPLNETTRKRLMTAFAVLLLLCLGLLFLSSHYHSQVALRLQHGKAFLEGSGGGSHQQFLVEIKPDLQRIRVVNINGAGRISVYLSPSPDYQEAVTGLRDWSFKWRDDEYLYIDLPSANLAPGRYYLHFVQEAGWGYFEYTISQGGGPSSYIAALAMGFLLACSVILGLALIVLGPAKDFI